MVHLVVSMTGAYSFVENRWYGGNIFEYLCFFMLVLYFAVDPSYWGRLSALMPYAALVFIYFVLGLISSPRMGELLRPALYTLASLTLLVCALPAVITDVTDLGGFARAVQVAAIICLGVCLAEATVPQIAEFLAQSGPLDSDEIRYRAFRTSGFLRNPNESANFFIIAFLLSCWCGGLPQVVGFIAAVVGTYLSASRSGAVILAACVPVCGIARLRCLAGRQYRGRRLSEISGFVLVCLLVIGGINRVNSGSFSGKELGLSRADRILEGMEGVKERCTVTDYWLPKALDAPIHGYGLRSFQGGRPIGLSSAAINDQGTHNTWVMLLGEVGPLGPIAFLFVLVTALLRIIRIRECPMDRMVLLLLWAVYLIFSVKAHTLFDFRYYTVVICLLLYIPCLLSNVTETTEPADVRAVSGQSAWR